MIEKLNVKKVNRLLSMMYYDMKEMNDKDRDLPIRWNVMHMYTSSQLGKLLAMKRGLDIELAALAGALHDIAVISSKKTEDHAKLAAPYVHDMIHRFNEVNSKKGLTINEEEENYLIQMIIQHSDKDNISDDPYTELLKDVDSLDRYLHGVSTEGSYATRCLNVLKELSIDVNEG